MKKLVCIKEETLVENPFVEIVRQDRRPEEPGAATDSAKSETKSYYLFKSRNWCNIIPVTEDGKLVLVRQYRIGIEQPSLEIPGGYIDHEDKNPKEAALRELVEETGYEPSPDARCIELGWTHPNPAIHNNKTYSMIVGPVRKTKDQKLDAGEDVDVEEVPIEKIPELLKDRGVTHALMLNAFYFLMLSQEKGAQALTEGLKSFQRPQ